jgi:hypothetical protein
MNYEMKYSRFAIDDNGCLTVVFDTPINDASPHKLYHALKEIALPARTSRTTSCSVEFGTCLSPVEVTHLEQLSEADKALKLGFSRQKSVSNRLLSTGKLNPEEHRGPWPTCCLTSSIG